MGEPVFDFGTGPRNEAMFNAQSSLLMIGGFGNLRGKIEMWDVAKKVMISTFDAPDSTNVSWCPDGQRLLTTTTSPRLRVSNSYKVWHYSGALQHEKAMATGDELWEPEGQCLLSNCMTTKRRRRILRRKMRSQRCFQSLQRKTRRGKKRPRLQSLRRLRFQCRNGVMIKRMHSPRQQTTHRPARSSRRLKTLTKELKGSCLIRRGRKRFGN